MRQIIGAALLLAASVMAMPALAAMSVINPAFSQSLEARPKKVVLPPPQVFVFELSAGGVPTRGRLGGHRTHVEYYLALMETQKPVDNDPRTPPQ